MVLGLYQSQWFLNSMLLLLLMIKFQNFSRYFSIFKIVFINNILHLHISFIVHITFSLLLPMIFSLVGIILLNHKFCKKTSITTVLLSVFWVIFIRSGQIMRKMFVHQNTALRTPVGSFSSVLNNVLVHLCILTWKETSRMVPDEKSEC